MTKNILTLMLVALFAISCGSSESSDEDSDDMINEDVPMETMPDPPMTEEPLSEPHTEEDVDPMESANADGSVANVGDPQLVNKEDSDYYTNEDGMVIHNVMDIKPTYMGGEEEMDKWIAKNITYPSSARRDNVEGTMVVSFIIDKEGNIVNPVIESGPENEALREEAKRVISEMPKWQAGMKNGDPVNAKYKLPITFKLQ
ncbi:energy transducer TonB [Mangrovivirga cuniculi]|uniref:TonB C-terminal domain-containing protein n=1 Tax=Mangrovivirga cuniculi TaxID=2715131 RepID=A0A4D7JUE5_9BACT|nr:energy transducer TonB [Mangrovivirga cuniculi]QCK14475.1 hypothetical protein DCC35_06835 [Mangrovivirga cuniculi]